VTGPCTRCNVINVDPERGTRASNLFAALATQRKHQVIPFLLDTWRVTVSVQGERIVFGQLLERASREVSVLPIIEVGMIVDFDDHASID